MYLIQYKSNENYYRVQIWYMLLLIFRTSEWGNHSLSDLVILIKDAFQ